MAIESLNAFERETTITASDGDELVRIWTAQRRYITRLRKHPSVTEVRSGLHGASEWAEFTVPAALWSPVGIKRASNMSPEARAEAGRRLAAARAGS